MVKTFKFDQFGYEVVLGKFAQQADGAVWIKQGGTIVLATVVSAPTDEFPGFLPLTVDYREYFSAAGKIPGGYFKREGKATDKEVLTCRLIDRAIRPLFPENFFRQVQVLATVYSVDKEHVPAPLAFNACALALSISKIPFLGPVAVVEVGRIDGKWVINPVYSDIKNSDVHLTIAGTHEGICMVEGSTQEISESDFVDALFLAHDKIKELVAWQLEIQQQVGVAKQEKPEAHQENWENKIDDQFWATWKQHINEFLTSERVTNCYIADKVERNNYLYDLRAQFTQQFAQEITEKQVPESIIEYLFDGQLRLKITELVFALKKRIDGRDYEQVRQISAEVGLLPFAHGSSLFKRGRTQALASATLGSGEDEQRIETVMDENGKDVGRFMLNYNFPPFAVGEVRMMRGPGRREVGHGHLASSAIRGQLPEKDAFPYTIRVVVDILESDGSSSMATVCSSTMALMDAGVPVKKMVSGIAMGLLKSADGHFAVLSDISGFEDAYGLMDFKVTGTQDGITAIQMDIKYKGGLSRDIFVAALEQARKGRLFILEKMRTVIEKSKPLSDLVPRFETVKINTDKIGAIIGTGGKTIREITEKTNTSIDIEEDGTVQIFGVPGANIAGAVNWVKTLAGQIDAGAIYTGKIRKIAEFGLFVELVPGQDGLVHVSNLPRDKQRNFMKEYQVGEEVTVEVIEYDEVSGRIRLRLLENAPVKK